MKRKFLDCSLAIIRKNNSTIDDVKLEEIAYGLEGIYLTVTKIVIIFTLAFILGIAKEVLLLLVLYNIIRHTAFGLHATKSIYCLISSTIMFVGGVFICEMIQIILPIKIAIAIFCVICIFKYAPADTEKRPIINPKKRKRLKIISTVSGIIFTFLIIIFNSHIISNYLLVAMIEAVIMIHPYVYKLFHLSYDNYKKYKVAENL